LPNHIPGNFGGILIGGSFGNALLGDLIPLLFSFSVLLTFSYVLLGILNIFEARQKRQSQSNTLNISISRIISLFVVFSLVLSMWAAIKGLEVYYHEVHLIFPHVKESFETINANYKARQNNIATASGFIAIILIFLLSSVQRNVYWITQKRHLKLDERQIKKRQHVFEASYKIAALILIASALVVGFDMTSVRVIIDNELKFGLITYGLFWPMYDIILLVVALPLITASFTEKQLE
jgi:hypothetical protein